MPGADARTAGIVAGWWRKPESSSPVPKGCSAKRASCVLNFQGRVRGPVAAPALRRIVQPSGTGPRGTPGQSPGVP
eukprot:15464376-Alexandrium_andersonii.AAC.1